MADIASIGTGSVGPVQRTSSPSTSPDLRDRAADVSSTRPSSQLGDRVELSDRARLLGRLRDLPDVRADRVREIRDAIADETYLTSEKLDVAVGRLLDDIDL